MNDTDTQPSASLSMASETYSAVTAAKELKQLIEDNRAAIANGRDLPPSLANALIQAGLTQLWAPRSLGGAQSNPLEFVLAIEALAKLDGSVAWCALISSSGARFAGMRAAEDLRQLMPSGTMNAFSGSGHPSGTITRDGHGWRVDGRWAMASFSRYSTVTFIVCVEHENGMPRIGANGQPAMRGVLLPSKTVEVLHNWNGAGLRSSGSHDIRCTAVRVPDAHTTTMDVPNRQSGALYDLPMTSAAAISMIGLPLGIAAASIDSLVSLSMTKVPFFSAVTLREQEHVQLEVAWAKARLLSARAFALETVTALWQAISSGQSSVEEQAMLRMACCNAGDVGKEVVNRMYALAGTTALPEEGHLAAQLRDIHAACQHINFANRLMIPPGRILLGLEPGTPML